MTDRIKKLNRYVVMYGLKEQINFGEWHDEPYIDCVPLSILKGAYELLKEQEQEQEPVRPIVKKEMDEITSYLGTAYYCGNCHAYLPLYKEYNIFCPKCGRKINWNDQY